jgi:putative membrane protein
MKTLVLNIDRDDDFGRKAGVKSPIVGLKANLDAANKLGQADPEDSDLNAIYSAISLYNSIIKENKSVEIATICGDINVGFKSDEILTKQLEDVIKKTRVDNVILVTDGAEDEYILPIIQSRIKITSKHRVSVKQSRELEDAYYRILKILDDDKVLKQFLLPIALVLIVWAVFVLLNMTASGFGAILLTLGLYLLVRVFRWERKIEYMWDEFKSGFLSGKLSLYTYALAIVILVAFAFLAYNNTDFKSEFPLIPLLSFLYNMVWGIVIAGLIAIFGRAVDTYMRDKKTPSLYYSAPFSLLAFGFVSYAVFGALYQALKNWPASFDLAPFTKFPFILYTISGILIAIIGAIIHHYVKENNEKVVESKAKKATEKN